MPKSGEHEITSARHPRVEPPSSSSSFGVFHAVFYLILFVLLLKSCASTVSESTLAEPVPPRTGEAIFESASTSSTAPALKVTLGGGSYEIQYLPANSIAAAVTLVGDRNHYLGDFNTGRSVGNEKTADYLILVGVLNVRINGLQNGTLLGEILTDSRKVDMNFDYSHTAQGPPLIFSMPQKKKQKIIVVGSIQNIHIGESRSYSSRNISIMELGPSAEESAHYQQALSTYREKIRSRNVAPRVRGTKPAHGR